MAFDEYQVDRIREYLKRKHINFEEKKMMGGLCIMVDDKMLCGAMTNKKTGDHLLMARVGKENYEQSLQVKGARPMTFTGRPLSGFLFVDPEGYDMDEDLEKWIDRCLAFNPHAKSSKKKSKK